MRRVIPESSPCRALYRLDDHDNLQIEYHATTTAPTPVNLANHAYFNLTGDPTVTVLEHVVRIEADRFTPVDATLIPTGELRSVAGTPFDFRSPHAVGERIGNDDEQLRLGRGYDHNWVLNGPGTEMQLAAIVTEPRSGRALEVRTTQPGVQFYTGNFMDGKPSGVGSVYGHRTRVVFRNTTLPRLTQPVLFSIHHPASRRGLYAEDDSVLASREVASTGGGKVRRPHLSQPPSGQTDSARCPRVAGDGLQAAQRKTAPCAA